MGKIRFAAICKIWLVPFAQYTANNDAAARFGKPERDIPSEKAFWVVQVDSAYEGIAVQSNDRDMPFAAQSWTLGYATGVGESSDRPTFVYHEEIRDVITDGAGANAAAPITFQPAAGAGLAAQIAAATSIIGAHEVMHRFLGSHNVNASVTNHGLMSGLLACQAPNGANPLLGVTALTGIQVQYVQTRALPA